MLSNQTTNLTNLLRIKLNFHFSYCVFLFVCVFFFHNRLIANQQIGHQPYPNNVQNQKKCVLPLTTKLFNRNQPNRHVGVQVELNNEGKIKLEETINESIINGDANSTANVSDSTLDDSKNITQNSDKTDATDNEVEPTAAVLSIDDPENGEIFKNHLISNNINNNHIPNKTDNEIPASNDATNTNTIDNTNDKRIDANGDVVNNDSDNKRLFNNSNTDAANAVRFNLPLQILIIIFDPPLPPQLLYNLFPNT